MRHAPQTQSSDVMGASLFVQHAVTAAVTALLLACNDEVTTSASCNDRNGCGIGVGSSFYCMAFYKTGRVK